ncbi:MAG TPA: VCBS repeat-containing protein, partial [Polyangiaceae bacterium]
MRKLLLVAALLLCTTCANLPDIDRNVCGNGVIDKGEQCDGVGVGNVPCYAQGVAACHLDCSSSDHTCPAGYACAADNVCRRGDGRFSKKSIDVSADVQRLASGDFDGDRRDDVVAIGAATTRVRFFDGNGNISGDPVVLSTGAGGTTVGSLSDDGLSGLVLSSSGFRPDPSDPLKIQLFGGDLNVLRGSETRTLLPSIYPNISVEATDLRLAVVKGANGPALFSLVRNQDQNLLGSAGVPTFLLDDLPKSYGKPGRIPQVKYPCESVVLPLGDQVHVYPACKGPPAKPVLNTPKSVDTITQIAAQTVQLKDGAPKHVVQAAGSAFGIFADNDVIADLLVAGNGMAYLAYGVADGTFNSTTPVPASGGDNVALPYGDFSLGFGAQVGQLGAPITPLAVGDVDGDALLDWIDGAGIHNGNTSITRPSPNGGTRWLDAYIGDANGNGAKDIVAVSAAGIDFYNGDGKGEFNLLSVPFDGTPTKLALGDFDGDFIPDIAVSASGGVGGDQGDALYVLFGKASGFPEPPQLVGRLPGVQQLAAVTAFDVGTVDQLIALTTRTDGRVDASGLVADATRQFSAPFTLATTLPGPKA